MDNIYTDVDLSFTRHPLTGDVPVLKDEIAIKRSLRHLILTNLGDRPWQPEKVTGMRDLLFDNINVVILDAIRSRIEFIIETGEPRVRVVEVVVKENDNRHDEIDVEISFVIINLNQEFTTKVYLQKVR